MFAALSNVDKTPNQDRDQRFEDALFRVIAQLLFNGLIAGSVISLASIGFSLVQLSRRFFDLSLAGTMVAVAYISFRASEACGGGTALVPGILFVLSFLLTVIVDRLAYRPLRSAGGQSNVMLVASLGVMVVCINIIALAFGDAPYRPFDPGAGTSIEILGGRITILQVIILSVAIVLGFAARFGVERVSFGTKLRALANDESLATFVGLPIGRVEVIGATLGLVFASGALVLSGLQFGLTPSAGFQLLIPAVTASIIGGIGSIRGALLGGYLVGILQQVTGVLLGVAWQDAILFCVIILIFLCRPTGLWRATGHQGNEKWST